MLNAPIYTVSGDTHYTNVYTRACDYTIINKYISIGLSPTNGKNDTQNVGRILRNIFARYNAFKIKKTCQTRPKSIILSNESASENIMFNIFVRLSNTRRIDPVWRNRILSNTCRSRIYSTYFDFYSQTGKCSV